MSDYAKKLRDPRWQRRRLEILQRDNFTCLDCGAKRSELHVHHCFYIFGKDPWGYGDECFRTLCDECHEARPEWEKKAVLEFKIFLAGKTRHELYDVVSALESSEPVISENRFLRMKRILEEMDK